MAEGINVRLSGKLQEFVKSQSDPENGKFNSSSEYIRHLIRNHYEETQERAMEALVRELDFGLRSEESAFIETSAADILDRARNRTRQK